MAQSSSHSQKREVQADSSDNAVVINESTSRLRREATQAEINSLPHVSDHIPFAAWAVIFAGAAERFTYFGIMSPWRA